MGLDVIMCVSCGAKWDHHQQGGGDGTRDQGGVLASQHKAEHPDHAVVVGDYDALMKVAKR